MKRKQAIYNRSSNGGMTLIEVCVYSVLLSFLLAGFIKFSADNYLGDIKTTQQIEDAYEQ